VNTTGGEYLYFKVTVKGAEPIFTFACKHRARRSAQQFSGHPKGEYEWTWSHNNNESDAADDMYVVGMLFITAIKYTLLVEHRSQDDQLINKLKDIDYESQEPSDSFTEALRVFTI
jgi:hypothetical protein